MSGNGNDNDLGRRYDVVIVGGGHNALVSATYLARAGLTVLLLERLDHVGGAAVSAQSFAGRPTRLSRYSYLVSLMPNALMGDLGLDVTLRSRRTASFTPYVRGERHAGLHVEHIEREATRYSFLELTEEEGEYEAWRSFYADVSSLAAVVAPTLLDPLPVERTLREQLGEQVWTDLVSTPLGAAVERHFRDDTVRGVVATDALIGTFASLHEPSLVQNRCFLYHLIGNGNGEWRVPVGGMGSVTGALHRAAVEAGATILTGAGVHRIDAETGGASVTWDDARGRHDVRADTVLANVAPWVLDVLRGGREDPTTKPVGSQLKINFLLDRLPALRSGVDPRVAFAGTLHLNEDYSQLEAAYADAAAGRVPTTLPGEVYCHSLTDPTIVAGEPDGTHTLTYFGLHTPASLFEGEGGAAAKDEAVARAIASLDQHLAEPLESCLARDADGRPCIEAKVPHEIEHDLAMPGGHIFHGDLDWPWAANRARLDTPAQQWGVQTDVDSLLLCGSGARRGGAVSGIAGHNAAQAVLASR